MKKEHFTGALFTVSAISWGVLIWYHFDNFHFGFIAPAILGLLIAVMIEVVNY